MFRRKEDYGSIPSADEDPTIVFAEAVPNDESPDIEVSGSAEDPEQPGTYSADDVIFVETAEAMDVAVVVENANPVVSTVLTVVVDPEIPRLIPDDVSVGTLSIDTSAKQGAEFDFCGCCDYRVAVIWINAAFLTILILVDVFPQAIDEYMLPIAMALVMCGIYGSIFLKRWAVLVAACYYVLFMGFVVVENVVNNKSYRALVRFCLFSGILYAHLKLSKLMAAGVVTPQNHPNIPGFSKE